MHANEEAHADRVTAAVWHAGFLYTASADGCIKVRSNCKYSFSQLDTIRASCEHCHSSSVLVLGGQKDPSRGQVSVSHHPVLHPATALTCGATAWLQIWDASLELVTCVRAAHGGGKVHALAVGPDGLIYTGGDDKVRK